MTCEYCKNQTATYCEHCLPDYLRNSTNRPQTLEELEEDAGKIIENMERKKESFKNKVRNMR